LSKQAWLTPDDSSVTLQSYLIFLPDEEMLVACFLGVLSMLQDAENWEEYGTMTPDKAADLFADAWAASVPLQEA